MTIVERVKKLALPLDEIVVIGSGLLDALSLRRAHDIDLAVSDRLFYELKGSGKYSLAVKHGEEVLERPGVEIWKTWGDQADETFAALKKDGVIIDSLVFCSPQMIIRHKQARGSEKDLQDITLLGQYINAHLELNS